MKIYFDEAGNSGQNLLDINQPIFALASVNFTLDETKEILRNIETEGEEIHFNRLRKYSKFHKQILTCLNHDLISSDRIKVNYYDKKFALIAHIVDQLIEPVLFVKGTDIYKKGLNISYSNLIYSLGMNLWNKELFNAFLHSFQRMIREKTDSSIDEFYKDAHILSEFVGDKDKILLNPILASKEQIKTILESIKKYSIDLTLPSVSLLSDLWNKELKKNIDIVHDDSKQIEFWKDYLYFVSKMLGDEKVEVGFDYRKMNFPLAIDKVTLCSSKDIPQIQLADLVASSITYCIKKIHIEKNRNDKLANDILKSKLGSLHFYPVMPSDKISPKDLGTEDDSGINPLDFLAEKIMEKGKK